MTETTKKDRDHARQIIALRVLSDRVKTYVDSQVKILHLDPETTGLVIHYMLSMSPSDFNKSDPEVRHMIIDEGEYFTETGRLFPPGVTTRKEAEAHYAKEEKRQTRKE